MAGLEELRARHEDVLRQHRVEMRHRNVRFAGVLAVSLAVIGYSLLVILGTRTFAEIPRAVLFGIFAYSLAMAILILDLALTQQRLRSEIQNSASLAKTSFELGIIVGREGRSDSGR